MTRSEALAQIESTLARLSDERLETLAELAEAWTKPFAYSSLSDDEKAAIDAALDELDRGEGLAWDDVRAELDSKLKAAGA